MDYEGFAVVELGLSSSDFLKLTYQEYWLLLLGFLKETERKKIEIENKVWFHSDLKAHIANFSMYKKVGGGFWDADDFLKKKVEEKTEKLTMKEARQRLGSTFTMHSN